MSYFGRNIRKIRNAKNISQTEFAKIFNLKRSSIGAYEEGRAEAKIDTIIAIADYFEISIDSLLVKELTLNEIFHLSKRIKLMSEKLNTEDKDISQKKLIEKNNIGIEERLIKIEKRMENIENLLKLLIKN